MAGEKILIFENLKIYYRNYNKGKKLLEDKLIKSMMLMSPFTPYNAPFWTKNDIPKNKVKDKEKKEQEFIFLNSDDFIKAVDNFSLNLFKNESIALIGETGSGKSSILYSAFSFPNDNIAHKSGKILYWDPNLECYVNLLELQEKEIVKYRGFHFGLIPQLPRESLNPWIQVGIQNGEILKERLKWKKEQARQKVIEFLGKVAISNPKINYRKYVNQMSAGEAQRVCISLALLAMPKIVFADEMFSSLDSLTQAQLIDLVLSLKKDLNMNFVLATHNIGAAGQLCEKIGVIYGGECIEFNDSNNFFKEPLHPYSKLLLESTPWYAVKSGKRLAEIPGEIPDSSNWPSGCKFHPRCPKATSLCAMKKPPRIYFGETFVECFLYAD